MSELAQILAGVDQFLRQEEADWNLDRAKAQSAVYLAKVGRKIEYPVSKIRSGSLIGMVDNTGGIFVVEYNGREPSGSLKAPTRGSYYYSRITDGIPEREFCFEVRGSNGWALRSHLEPPVNLYEITDRNFQKRVREILSGE